MLFIYSKMTVFDCLKSLTLSAGGNDDGMLRNKFVVVCKCPGGGTLLTVKCPAPRTHRETNARCLPERMLTVPIDSHITVIWKPGLISKSEWWIQGEHWNLVHPAFYCFYWFYCFVIQILHIEKGINRF